MKKMKILITGGSGFYGEFLNRILDEDNQILSLYHKNIGSCNLFNSVQTDITDTGCPPFIISQVCPLSVLRSYQTFPKLS